MSNNPDRPKSIFARSRRAYVALGYSPIPRWHDADRELFPTDWVRFCTQVADDKQLQKWDHIPVDVEINIAVCCGYRGLVAIDLDVESEELKAALLTALPHATVGRFGSKGIVLFFRHESGKGIQGFSIKTGPYPGKVMLEVLGHGRNITIPPSMHRKSGKPYHWINPHTGEHVDERPDFDDLPIITDDQLAFLKVCFEPWTTTDDRQRADKPKERDSGPVEEGRYRSYAQSQLSGMHNDLAVMLADSGRNNALNICAFRLGWAVGKYLTEQEIFQVLTDACRQNGLVADDGLDSVEKTIESGLARGIDECDMPHLPDRPFTGSGAGARQRGNKPRSSGSSEEKLKVVGGTDTEAPKKKKKKQSIDISEEIEDEGGGSDHKDGPIKPKFRRNNEGAPYKDEHNFIVAMSTKSVSFKYNQFTGRQEIYGWEKYDGNITDDAWRTLRVEVHTKYGIKFTKEDFPDYILRASKANVYHPVMDYFNSIKWDGVRRLDTWLHDYCNADDTPANRSMGSKWLIAAVRRIRYPGTKFDTMLILEGAQDLGKSTVFKKLCPNDEWFTSSINLSECTGDNGLRRLIYQTQGKMIVEIPELSGLTRAQVQAVKALISNERDEVDLKYGRFAETFKRQFVFAGSTNEDEYLQDVENRRFWPVWCGHKEINYIGIERDRDLLWAEAVAREKEGEKIFISRADPEYQDVKDLQTKRKIVDEIDNQIHPFLYDLMRKEKHDIEDKLLKPRVARTTLQDAWEASVSGDSKFIFNKGEQERTRLSFIRAGWDKGKRSHGKRWWLPLESAERLLSYCAGDSEWGSGDSVGDSELGGESPDIPF